MFSIQGKQQEPSLQDPTQLAQSQNSIGFDFKEEIMIDQFMAQNCLDEEHLKHNEIFKFQKRIDDLDLEVVHHPVIQAQKQF